MMDTTLKWDELTERAAATLDQLASAWHAREGGARLERAEVVERLAGMGAAVLQLGAQLFTPAQIQKLQRHATAHGCVQALQAYLGDPERVEVRELRRVDDGGVELPGSAVDVEVDGKGIVRIAPVAFDEFVAEAGMAPRDPLPRDLRDLAVEGE